MTAQVSEAVTERMAQALRDDATESFSTTSHAAACLLPLLNELGWHNYARELIEALPHFSEELDLVDLRNILVTLGYESSPIKTRIIDIKEELYPCLFLGNDDQLLVLLEREENQVKYFDPSTERNTVEDILWAKGTAYVFTDTHPSHGISSSENNQ